MTSESPMIILVSCVIIDTNENYKRNNSSYPTNIKPPNNTNVTIVIGDAIYPVSHLPGNVTWCKPDEISKLVCCPGSHSGLLRNFTFNFYKRQLTITAVYLQMVMKMPPSLLGVPHVIYLWIKFEAITFIL